MTLRVKRQSDSPIDSQLKRILLSIKQIKKWSDWEFNGKLAEEFKMDHRTAWRITAKWQSTEQFKRIAEIALENLKLKVEVQELRKLTQNKPLLEQVAELIQKNQDLEAAMRGQYPEIKPTALILNEDWGEKPNSAQIAKALEQARLIVLALGSSWPPGEDNPPPGSTAPPRL